METKKCKCGGTMHHSSDMNDPGIGHFWQCEMCGLDKADLETKEKKMKTDQESLYKTINPAPEDVRNSEFGCRNCLWRGIECVNGRNYKHNPGTGSPCLGYTYYD